MERCTPCTTHRTFFVEGSYAGMASVMVLLKYGANVNQIDEKGSMCCAGSTALHYAASWGDDVRGRLCALLLKNGADWTIKDDEGFTPLDRAQESNHHQPSG